MKHTLILLFIISIFCSAQAQDVEPPQMKFGKGLAENFDQEFSDIIDNQEAVYIFDKLDLYYGIDGEKLALYEDYHARIKVLDGEASDIGNIKIRYIVEDKYQNIFDIKACSYTLENGAVVEHKLKKKDIFKTRINDRITELSFAIPNVKEGAIFEYTFKKSSRRKYSPNTYYFSNDYPVAYSQVTFNIPEWFAFTNYSRGVRPYVIQDYEGATTDLGTNYADYSSTKYIWAKTNLEAFEDEDFTANSLDFRDQMQFRLNSINWPGETMQTFNTTWTNLNDNLLQDDYASQLKDKKDIDEIVGKLVYGLSNEGEIIKALFDYVVENVALEEEGWVYTSKPVKRVLIDKSGNVADANLLLINMLQSAGIEAYPMLISTRTDGYIDMNYPTMRAFTYPVAYVNSEGKDLILNATSASRPYFLPRLIDYNLSGWLVREQNPTWVEIEDMAPNSLRYYNITAQLSEDGTYSGDVTVSSKNYLSVSDRVSINDDSVEDRLLELYSGTKDIEITNTDHTDLNDAYSNFSYNGSFEIKNHGQSINDFIYFSPLIFEIQDENPFTKEERNYPVDFPYPRSTIHAINVTLPEGYQLEETPEPVIVQFGDMASIRIIMKELNGTFQIQVKEDLKETVIQPEYYQDLRKYIDKVIEQTTKQVTLVKSK